MTNAVTHLKLAENAQRQRPCLAIHKCGQNGNVLYSLKAGDCSAFGLQPSQWDVFLTLSSRLHFGNALALFFPTCSLAGFSTWPGFNGT